MAANPKFPYFYFGASTTADKVADDVSVDLAKADKDGLLHVSMITPKTFVVSGMEMDPSLKGTAIRTLRTLGYKVI